MLSGSCRGGGGVRVAASCEDQSCHHLTSDTVCTSCHRCSSKESFCWIKMSYCCWISVYRLHWCPCNKETCFILTCLVLSGSHVQYRTALSPLFDQNTKSTFISEPVKSEITFHFNPTISLWHTFFSHVLSSSVCVWSFYCERKEQEQVSGTDPAVVKKEK